MCVLLKSMLHMCKHWHPVAQGLTVASNATLFRVETVMLQDEYRREAGSVVEVDYYNATSLLGLTDEQLIQRTLQTYLAACHPAYGLSQVQDSSVLRSAWSCRPSDCCHAETAVQASDSVCLTNKPAPATLCVAAVDPKACLYNCPTGSGYAPSHAPCL